MTLAAVKKLAVSLPLRQRLQLADALYGSLPALRGPAGMAELERRAEEVSSDRVKALDADEVLAGLAQLVRSKTHRRRRQRG